MLNLKMCEAPGCENEFEAYPVNKKYCSVTCKNRAGRLSEPVAYVLPDDEGDFGFGPDAASDVIEVDDDVARMEFLRKENTRLARAHEKSKSMIDETLTAILKTVAENVKSIKVPQRQAKEKVSGQRELVLNVWNSDTQIGKVTPSYNTEIAYERVAKYTDKILQTLDEFSDQFSITKCHVWDLGDMVEGENIFPTQSHLIDTSVFRQATVDGPQMYGDQFRRLLERVSIERHSVIGNHGRLGRYTNPETNMDRVLYQVLYWMFHENPNVKFSIPMRHGESMFYDVAKIGNYSTLLVHGDQFGPPTTQNTYVKKVLSWKAGGVPVHFQDVAMGHYHQNVKFTIGETVVRIAGSTESHNTFAQERLGVMGRPSQHLQLVDPDYGVYWETDVYLD